MSSDASAALLRLSRESAMLAKKATPGVRFDPGGADAPLVWTMHVDTPEQYTIAGVKRPCPYAGRCFAVTIKYPVNYPFKAPEVRARKRARARARPNRARAALRGTESARRPARASHAAAALLPPRPAPLAPPAQLSFVPGQVYHPNVIQASGEMCGEELAKVFGPTKNSTDLAKCGDGCAAVARRCRCRCRRVTAAASPPPPPRARRFVLDILSTPNVEHALEAVIAAEMRDNLAAYEAKARKACVA